MGRLGPVFLAWAHLRHRRGGLVGPLLLLAAALTLLFVQVGLYQAACDLDRPEGDTASAPFARGFLIGEVGLFLLLPLLLHHLLVPEITVHSREFALLRVLGYGPLYVAAVVLAEMLLLVLLAFVPAALLLPLVYALVRAGTGLPLAVSLPRLGSLLLLTLALASVVALLGCRKAKILYGEAWLADPGDLF
jgi:hypothetical protein